MQFSSEQRRIIKSRHQHTLIPAVPGSGKTTLLIEWVASQIESGELKTPDCTIIMFNVAAKDQFIARLKKRLAHQRLPQVLTFHALGNRIYRSMVERGYLPSREIIAESHRVELIANQCIVQCIGQKKWQTIKEADSFALDTFIQFIEQVKAQLSTPDKTFKDLKLSPKASFFIEAYHVFEEHMQQTKKMTLTDLIYLPVKACMDDTTLIAKLSDRRDFIAVDEAQDMNLNQFQLFRILAGKRARTALIGDNDQTIYSWRGSDPNIMASRYQKQFKNVELMPLSYTFRYGHELAMASSSLISYNTKRLETLCFSAQTTGSTTLSIHPTSDEGKTGCELIEKLLDTDRAKYKDIIVLCSLYASSTSIELACLAKGIPVFVTGGNTVFRTKEADFIYSLLMMATGEYYSKTPKERAEILTPLFRSPSLYLKSNQVTELVNRLSTMQPFPVWVKDMPKLNNINQFTERHIQRRIEAISRVLTTHVEANAYFLINEYLHSVEYFTRLSKDTLTKKQSSEVSDRMHALIHFIRSKNTPAPSMLKLFSQMRNRQIQEPSDDSDAITVTTVYQAKGLDCDHVIMPAVNDARYPYEMSGDFIINQDVEEERRLLYVGMTRAIKSIHLLCPDDPGIREYLSSGKVKKRRNRKRIDRASRFIYEMQPALVKILINDPTSSVNHPTLLKYQERLTKHTNKDV